MDLDAIARELRSALPDVLVALDFDGTLAPIVPDPQDSRPVHGAVAALNDLAARGARVAVVTGRDADTVLRLGGLTGIAGLTVTGLYGLETWRDGALDTPDTPDEIRTLQERLPGVLADAHADPDVWIEDKRLSLVVHGRLADDPEAALEPLRDPVARLAADLGLEMHPGNGVLELRLPGFDKAGALRRLVERSSPRAVLFAGDDVGDLPAFEQVRRLRDAGVTAWGVAVLSSGVAEVADAADVTVATPADLVALLEAI